MSLRRTRLSLGALAIAGLGAATLGVAAPASAETQLVYTCSTALGNQDFNVVLDTDAPSQAAPGDAIDVSVTGSVQLNPNVSNALAGAFGWDYASGSVPNVEATVTDGTNSTTATVDLSIPKTQFFSAAGWTQPSGAEPIFPLTSEPVSVTAGPVGSYDIEAPSTFDATFLGYGRDGARTGDPVNVSCTYKSGERTVDTIEVTDAPTTTTSTTTTTTSTSTTSSPTTTGEPTTTSEPTSTPTVEVDDWFAEPSSMEVVDDRTVLKATGRADKDGVVLVEMRDADGNVLKTYTWNVTEGENARDFAFVEGTRAVRLVSQDCVDANGLTGEDAPEGDDESGNGCNVEYTFPEDQTSTSTGDDDGPETPGVVQTDSLQRVDHKEAGSPAALLLGGLMVAGAGAGAVMVVRRRQAAQH